MKHIEYLEQCKVFEWAFYNSKKYPALEFMFASQSGEKFKSALQGARAKKAGMRAGVPDIFLPYPNNEYAGLFIELKRPIVKGESKPVISDSQHKYLLYLASVGYKAIVCYGANDAIVEILNYLNKNT